MCGRYTLVATQDELVAEFDLYEALPITPNHNIRPTQAAPVVRQDQDGRRRLALLRWGLIPHWSQGPDSRFTMINARSEEAAIKPAFRQPFKTRRCLVPCSGFYEWKALDGASKKSRKQPYVFRSGAHPVLAMAGLWDRWEGPSGPVESFTILTTAADDIVAPFHDRMPVVLPRAKYATWLDPALRDPAVIGPLMSPSGVILEPDATDLV